MNQADFEAIANGAYGGRLGNGNYDSGDGWRFRGRGLTQMDMSKQPLPNGEASQG